MNNSPTIEVLNLHRSFGETKAVQGVSFEVRPGEIFSLLGPNGAGKTTIISMLCCLLGMRIKQLSDLAGHDSSIEVERCQR